METGECMIVIIIIIIGLSENVSLGKDDFQSETISKLKTVR